MPVSTSMIRGVGWAGMAAFLGGRGSAPTGWYGTQAEESHTRRMRKSPQKTRAAPCRASARACSDDGGEAAARPIHSPRPLQRRQEAPARGRPARRSPNNRRAPSPSASANRERRAACWRAPPARRRPPERSPRRAGTTAPARRSRRSPARRGEEGRDEQPRRDEHRRCADSATKAMVMTKAIQPASATALRVARRHRRGRRARSPPGRDRAAP